MQTGNKRWNYNTDGVANYGLMADFINDLNLIGAKQEVTTLMSGAEYFAQMWEKCARIGPQIR